jgi:CRISPR/Cas system-associated protein Csx1
MTAKEKQRELIVEIMKADEKSGLYDEPSGKKTPVELLFDALWTAPKDKFVWQSILKQAKEIEKQEIMIAFHSGDYTGYHDDDKEVSEYYYNKTYDNQ